MQTKKLQTRLQMREYPYTKKATQNLSDLFYFGFFSRN